MQPTKCIQKGATWGAALFTAALLATPLLHADIRLELIGEYQSGVFDESAAEINAYDPATNQLFVVNANSGLIDVLDLTDVTSPSLVTSLDPDIAGAGDVNSVAVMDGVLAAAVANENEQESGFAVFYDTSDLGSGPVNTVTVGALPDMVIFTPDGSKVLTANEGEPNEDYTVDPVGSVSIIDISGGVGSAGVTTVSWDGLDAETVRATGVRIFGPGASVAQDLEPEYIAVSPDSATAYVVMQENNALGLVDLNAATAGALVPLGTKDHSLPGNGFDGSDDDDVINIANWPTKGLYQPDAIKMYEIDGTPYYFTANEGDTRDYDGFSEEADVEDLTLDPTAFPDAAMLQTEQLIGKLLVTDTLGDTDGDGDYDELYSIGGRSFAIWAADGSLVWESGDQFEQVLADLKPLYFNSDNDENGSFDGRSDAKGPEPEAVEVAAIGDNVYAFIGLERMGGVMIYDVSDPAAPMFVGYETSRDFTVEDVENNIADAREMGPEDLTFVPAGDNTRGVDLLIVSSEVSGSITIYEIKERDTFSLSLLHFNDPESQLVHAGSLQNDPADAPTDGFGGPDNQFVNFGGAARFLTKLNTLRSEAATDGVLVISAGDNFLPGIELDASMPDRNADNPEGIHYDALTIAAANLDVSAIGNHEFDLGPDYLKMWYDQVRTGETVNGAVVYPTSDVPYVSSNLDASAVPELDDYIVPSVIVEKSGERIGVIGATTWFLPEISSTGDVEMIDANGDNVSSIEDVAQLVQDEVDALEADGVNKIILVTHLQNIRNEQDLVGRIRGVDVVIGGGGNELLANEGDPVVAGREPVGPYPLLEDADGNAVTDLEGVNVPVVVSDGDFRYIGKLDLEFDADGNLVSYSGSPQRVSAFTEGVSFEDVTLANDGVEPDPFLVDMVQTPVFDYATVQFQTVLADSEVTLESRRSDVSAETGLVVGKRVRETNLGNLTADAVLYEGTVQAAYLGTPNPDIGFQNGGGIRNDGTFAPGQLTLGDVFNFLPFTNFNTVIEGITPQILKEMMEQSVSELPDAGGQFLQIAGFSIVYDPTRQAQETANEAVTVPGERIRRIELDDGTVLVENGEVVAAGTALTAATNSFVAGGGDGYYWLESLPQTNAPSLYGDALINYVNEVLEGEITVVDYGPGTVGFRIQSTTEYVLDFVEGVGTDQFRESSWLGPVFIGFLDLNWIWDEQLGWIYVLPFNESREGVWLYVWDYGWLWTEAAARPSAWDPTTNDWRSLLSM